MKTLLNELAKATVVLGVAVSSFFPSKTFAKDIWVPTQKPTIQSAIDSAVDKDRIILHDGTYSGAGNYDIQWNANNKHLTIKSASGKPENCVIDANSEGRGFILNNGQTNQDIIDGITIRRGKAFTIRIPDSRDTTGGGAILIQSSSPRIQNCILENNLAYNGGYDLNWLADGGAIDIESSSSPIIYKNIIRNNTATHGGGGINVNYNSNPIIDSNIIQGNLAEACFGGGGIAYTSGCAGVVKNCLISGNTAWYYGEGGYGGGIGTSNSNPEIINCTIINNSTIKENSLGGGGGINVSGLPFPIIENCILYGNESSETLSSNYAGNKNIAATIIREDIFDISYSLIEGKTGTIPKETIQLINTIIDADPKLASDGYHLLQGSPCIDSGTNTGINCDIDGNLRPQDGNGDGIAKYDIGCYELPLRNAVRDWKRYE